MTRVEELTLKLADGELSDQEFEELERLVLEEPEAARTYLALLDLEAELRTQTQEPGLSNKTMQRLREKIQLKNAVMDQIRNQVESKEGTKRSLSDTPPRGVPDPAREVSSGDSRRMQNPAFKRANGLRSPGRVSSDGSLSWKWPALAAAGFLAALFMLFALGPSDPAPAKIGSQKKPPVPKAVEVRRGADQEEENRRQVQAEVLRREWEARLREIERRREELAHSAPQPAPDAGELERRKAEERKLASEKDKIEKELKDAIGLARKAPETPPVDRPKEQKTEPPPKSPSGQEAPQGTESLVATVERVEGSGNIVGKEGRIPTQANQGVKAGQGVETGGKSFLVLKYPDGTRLELGEETALRELVDKGGKRLFIEKGVLKAQVAKQLKDQPMILATPHGEAKVVGTTLRVTVDPDSKKGTRLEVEEGKVELKNLAGKSVLVDAGHYALAAKGVDFVARRQDTPTNVPRAGLAVWLRADQGVMLSGSGGVATWADRSGNKHDAVQPVPAQQPMLVPMAVQGLPALRFDGVDDCMTFPCAVSGLTGMTIFLVSSTLEERGAANYAANAALYWQETASCSGVVLNPSQSKVWCYFGTGQIQPLLVYSRPTVIDRGFSLTTSQKSGPEILLYVNGQETLRIRGQKPAIGSNEKNGQIGRGEGDQLTNGQFQGQREGWTYFSGEIAELMVYTRALGEFERKLVEQYLLSKYLLK